jgi:hypothetical protein
VASSRGRASALGIAIAIAGTSRVATAVPAGVTLAIDPCAGVPAPFVERVVSAELSGDTRADARAVDVRVTCRDGLVVIEAATGGTGAAEPTSRTIDLEHEDAAARPRVLSVAIAELVSAIRARPAPAPPEPPPAPPPPPEPSAPEPAPPPRARPWTIAIAGVTRGFSSLVGFGGGISASHLTRAHLGVRADVDLTDATAHVALGDVDARLASFAAQGVVGAAWGSLAIDGGAGARVGVATLTGHPGAAAVGHAVTGAWAGPLASLRARWSFVPAWSIAATAEGGWIARATTGLVADGPSVSIEDAWWSASLGVAWSP